MHDDEFEEFMSYIHTHPEEDPFNDLQRRKKAKSTPQYHVWNASSIAGIIFLIIVVLAVIIWLFFVFPQMATAVLIFIFVFLPLIIFR